MNDWLEIAGMVACVLTAYLLIELNTAFSLIRTRTAFHACLYVFFSTMCFFLHPFRLLVALPLLFLLALFPLFRSYESGRPVGYAFNAFFCIGLGSLLFPQLLFFVPLFYLGTIGFRSFSFKSFCAGLIGLAVPYWFLFGHAFFHDRMELFYRPWQELVYIQTGGYAAWDTERIVSGLAITLLSWGSTFRYFRVSHLDKVRTRFFLYFLIAVEAWIYLLGIWQPRLFDALLSLQLVVGSVLVGHLSVLARSRFSGILFSGFFGFFVLLAAYNLWMQFFTS